MAGRLLYKKDKWLKYAKTIKFCFENRRFGRKLSIFIKLGNKLLCKTKKSLTLSAEKYKIN